MQENLLVERLVRKALRAEEPIGRTGIRQLGIPQGAKRLEERPKISGKMRQHFVRLHFFVMCFVLRLAEKFSLFQSSPAPY